jgi:hypothetical protein
MGVWRTLGDAHCKSDFQSGLPGGASADKKGSPNLGSLHAATSLFGRLEREVPYQHHRRPCVGRASSQVRHRGQYAGDISGGCAKCLPGRLLLPQRLVDLLAGMPFPEHRLNQEFQLGALPQRRGAKTSAASDRWIWVRQSKATMASPIVSTAARGAL